MCHSPEATLTLALASCCAASLHDAIEADIVLQRIRAHEVVVVRRRDAHRDPARLIDLAGDRLEAGAHLDIRRRDRAVNRQGKAQIRLCPR